MSTENRLGDNKDNGVKDLIGVVEKILPTEIDNHDDRIYRIIRDKIIRIINFERIDDLGVLIENLKGSKDKMSNGSTKDWSREVVNKILETHILPNLEGVYNKSCYNSENLIYE